MAEASDTESILRQNLIDAGCDLETVQQCMELSHGKKTAEMKRILTRHRKALLDTVHAEQKKIDCLDYLFYKMEKDKRPKGSPPEQNWLWTSAIAAGGRRNRPCASESDG